MSDVEFSNGLYKWRDKEGKLNISERAPPPGALPSDITPADDEFKDNKCKGIVYTTQVAHKQVEDCIKKIKKAAKAPDYLEKAEKLKYVKDQKLDPYKSFKEYKRLDDILLTPGPKPDVLDTRGRIVPPKEVTYSDSRLGQYNKVEDPKLAKAGAESEKAALKAKSGLIKSFGAAISRALGPFLDVVTAPLDTEIATSAGYQVLRARLDHLEKRGIIDMTSAEYGQISSLIGSDPAKANQMLQEVQRNYIKGP
jgi:hypothetical protein